jgi:hypothetical protein
VGFRSAGTGILLNDDRSIPHPKTENQLKSLDLEAKRGNVRLRKPFTLGELSEKVQELLRKC